MDTLLIAASQTYKSGGTASYVYKIDDLLLAVSTRARCSQPIQWLPVSFSVFKTSSHLDLPCRLWRSKVVQRSVMTCICYSKLRNCWEATYRLKCLSHEERSCGHKLNVIITELDTAAICFWLQRFVLEVRKRSGEHFAQIVCTNFAVVCNEIWGILIGISIFWSVPVCPVLLHSWWWGEWYRQLGGG